MVAKVQATVIVEFEYDDELDLVANDQAIEELASQLCETDLIIDEFAGAEVIENASESEKYC